MNKIILKIATAACAAIILAAGTISFCGCHIHNYALVSYNEPTCVKNGFKKYKCTECGKTKTEQVVRTGEHNFEYVVSPATCFNSGYTTERCSYCGLYYEIEYTAPTHSFVDGVCSECGGYEYGSDGLKYFVSGGAATLVAYTGTDKDVIVPVSVEGCNVIMTLDAVFADRDDITSVTLPKSVTYIGLRAFANCTSLKSVTGTDNVTEIGDSAFLNCSSLSSFTFSPDIYLIEQSGFEGSGLSEICISSGEVTLGDSAFKNCKNLISADMSDAAVTVGDNAFSACEKLSSVKLGLKSRNIGDGAFMGCSALVEAEGLNNVCFIGEHAFAGCSSLVGVSFGKRLNYIGRNAFKDCSSLMSATFEEYDMSLAYYYSDEAYNYALILSDENRRAGVWRAKDIDGSERELSSLSDGKNNAALLSEELCSCLWIVPAPEADLKKFLEASSSSD